MIQSTQLSFDLPFRKAMGREDFCVAPCNQQAVAWIDKSADWPMHALLIYGEKGSGKSHLSHIFSNDILDARELTADFIPTFKPKWVVENLENLADETALFHLFNFVRETGGYLLLTSDKVPDFKLPDLQSRLMAIPKARIEMPDESVMRAVVHKAFDDRQVWVDDSVPAYMTVHLARSFSLLHQVIDVADKMALSASRKITVPVIKAAIDYVKNQKGSSDET